MVIAITQPTYLPWMGYFEAINRADIFVFLDTAQFEKQSWQSRNRILTPEGNISWLSVPVCSSLESKVADVKIAKNPSNWRRKHLSTLRQSLSKGEHSQECISFLSEWFDETHDKLADLNISFIRSVSEKLDLETKFVKTSEMKLKGKRGSLLREVCRYFGADQYYANKGSAVYLENDRNEFSEIGVDLQYQEWEHPKYAQFGRSEFTSHLSIVDSIANIGFLRTSELIKN